MFVWVPACIVGVALPSMLSVQFLQRGLEVDKWNTAVMTAGGVQDQVTTPQEGVLVDTLGLTGILSGPGMGQVFWALTLLCGFLVLAPSVSATVDGVIRRWVDAFWTASPMLRRLKPENIRLARDDVGRDYGVREKACELAELCHAFRRSNHAVGEGARPRCAR